MILWSVSSIGKRVSLLCVLAVSVWLLTGTHANGQAATAPATLDEFVKAVVRGDLPAVQSYIANGMDVNAKDSSGGTALMAASAFGHTDIMELLISKGADVNAKTSDGTSILHISIARRQEDASKLLLKKGANINAIMPKGGLRYTPLYLAINLKLRNFIFILIDAGADVNIPNGTGYFPDYPLEQAAWYNGAIGSQVEGQWNDVIDALVAKGARSPWLSRVKEFDPHHLVPITPEKDQRGHVMLGSMPMMTGQLRVMRPWKLPNTGIRDVTGTNRSFYRWANPLEESGPLTATVIDDDKGNETELQLVPTIYIGQSGVAYPENVYGVDKNGPFVDITVDASAGIARVAAVRGNGEVVELNRSGNSFRGTLSGVADFEPISVTKYGEMDTKQLTTEFDCALRAARSGAVIYHVR